MFFLKEGGNMRKRAKEESFDFYQRNYGWHQSKRSEEQEESLPISLTTDVKDRVISLLFGSVSDGKRKKLHEYMDDRFEQCHSLALFVTDKDRTKKPEEKSSFTIFCEKLGLNPGRKEVQVTDKMQILFSDDYTVPVQPR